MILTTLGPFSCHSLCLPPFKTHLNKGAKKPLKKPRAKRHQVNLSRDAADLRGKEDAAINDRRVSTAPPSCSPSGRHLHIPLGGISDPALLLVLKEQLLSVLPLNKQTHAAGVMQLGREGFMGSSNEWKASGRCREPLMCSGSLRSNVYIPFLHAEFCISLTRC